MLLIAAIEVSPLAWHGAVPAFQQDWTWPVDRAQIGPFFHSGLSPWRSDGIGWPLVYPTAWWPFVLAGSLCYVFGVHGGVVALLLLALFGAAAAAAAFAGRIGADFPGRFFAGAAYAANPLVLNEVQAGHWVYLLCYALLPVIAIGALSPRSVVGKWFILGGLVGLGAGQSQFLPMGLLAVAAFTIVSSRTHKLRDFVLIVAMAAVVTAPQWVLGLLIAGPDYLNVLKPLPHWEIAQSASMGDALRLLGYIGGYDRVLLNDAARFSWWWLPVLATVRILVGRKNKVTWALGLLAVFGILIVSGIRGPAGALWVWLFAHVPAAALFRELYHGAALAAFAMTSLAALGIDAFWGKRAIWAFAAGVVALAACLFVAARTSSNVPTVALNRTEAFDVSAMARAPGFGRYLALPAVLPIAASNAVGGGVSPFVWAIGSHPALSTFVPTFPSAYAFALLRENRNAQAEAVLRSEAVAFVLRLSEWTSTFDRNLEPNLRGLVLPAVDRDLLRGARFEELGGGERVVVEAFSTSPHSLPGTYTGEARDLRAVEDGQQIDIIDPTVSPNPRDAWARTALWPVLPAWALAQPPGVFTLRQRTRLTVPAALIIAGAADGPPRSASCRPLNRLGGNFALFACGPDPVFSGRPPIVVSSAFHGGRPIRATPRLGSLGETFIDRSSDWLVRMRVKALPGSVIVLRERFDPEWICSVAGARHVEVDGYANAWILPKALVGESVIISYAGAPLFLALLCLSIFCVATTATVAVVDSIARLMFLTGGHAQRNPTSIATGVRET